MRKTKIFCMVQAVITCFTLLGSIFISLLQRKSRMIWESTADSTEALHTDVTSLSSSLHVVKQKSCSMKQLSPVENSARNRLTYVSISHLFEPSTYLPRMNQLSCWRISSTTPVNLSTVEWKYFSLCSWKWIRKCQEQMLRFHYLSYGNLSGS